MIKKLTFFSFFILTSCVTFKVYFNTIYNAKKYFKEAEKRFNQNNKRITQDVKSLYDKALEKYLRVIKYFPNSPFLDDALFYSGLIYIRLDDKNNAIKKFEEISKYFPKSVFTKMISDSLLFYLLEKEDIENSFYILSFYPDKNSNRFYFYKSRFFEMNEKYDSSLYYARKILDISSESLKESVITIYVKSALKKGLIDSALYFLERYGKGEKLSLLLAQAYMEKKEFEKAKNIILSFDPENKNFEAIKLLVEIYKREGDNKELKKVIKNFLEKNEDHQKKQEMGFEIAFIYFKEDSIEALRSILSEVKKISPSTEYGRKANIWYELIEREKNLRERKEEEIRRELLKIGESYYIDIGLYEKALKIFDEYLQRFPDDKEVPRVLYLIIFIYKNFIKDEMKVEEYFKTLEKRYGRSFYYVVARDLLGKN